MAKLIYPEEFWQNLRLPRLRDPDMAPDSFTPEQARDFKLAMNILAIMHKPDGSRRSIYGLNRAAQKRWPGRGINSDLVGDIFGAFAIAGRRGVADLILQGKLDMGKEGKVYHSIRHSLFSLAIVVADDLADSQEEVFLLPTYLVELMDGHDPPARFYRVAAETNYGIFKFAVLSHRVPEWRDVEDRCLWHTRHDINELDN
jgi:hypothetical protein